jgi:hypothetical protein
MKTLCIVLLSFVTNFLFAQTNTNYDNVKLEQASDYVLADSFAIEAANFLFATPFEKDNLQRLKSLSFVIRWIVSSPKVRPFRS